MTYTVAFVLEDGSIHRTGYVYKIEADAVAQADRLMSWTRENTTVVQSSSLSALETDYAAEHGLLPDLEG